MNDKTTPQVALELVTMNIANAAFLLAQTQIRPDQRTTITSDGREVRTVPSIKSVREFVQFVPGFETYFAPLLRNDNGEYQYLPDVGVERRKYIWGPSNAAAEFNFRVHQQRCSNAVDLMVAFKDELSKPTSGTMLEKAIAQRQHEAADKSFIMLPPEVPEKLHQPTIERLEACREFVADRAAFDLFMVHSVLVGTAQTRGSWTRRSKFVTTSGEPHVPSAMKELMEIRENGIELLEEGQKVEELVAENDHHEYSVVDLMSGRRIDNNPANQLPVVEYEKAMQWLEPGRRWFDWVEVLGAETEFATNVEQTIRKALERVEQARTERSQGTVVQTVPIAS